jgi:Fe-S oxidoreductase
VGTKRVLLFADTFNSYFHVDTAKAAVEVLEDAGYQVIVPMQDMCCGRPLYDYGMLPMAKRWLHQILDVLRPYIQDGVPMVVLEPSCCAVFRDELCGMLPDDQDAKRLSNQTFLLDEFLINITDYEPPKLHRKVLAHGHCHHKAIMTFEDQKQLIKKMELDYEIPDSGCCGMAGSFGFENESRHYEVSMAVGERVLLPKVRDAANDTLIMTDGFSCRTQIEQGTDRYALHSAQVLQLALHEGVNGPAGRPEQNAVELRDHERRAGQLRVATSLVLGAFLGALAYRKLRHPHCAAGRNSNPPAIPRGTPRGAGHWRYTGSRA